MQGMSTGRSEGGESKNLEQEVVEVEEHCLDTSDNLLGLVRRLDHARNLLPPARDVLALLHELVEYSGL